MMKSIGWINDLCRISPELRIVFFNHHGITDVSDVKILETAGIIVDTVSHANIHDTLNWPDDKKPDSSKIIQICRCTNNGWLHSELETDLYSYIRATNYAILGWPEEAKIDSCRAIRDMYHTYHSK